MHFKQQKMWIRDSLNYHTYIEHSKSILYAADENFELLKSYMNVMDQDSRIKTLGLYRSTMLLYAVSLELILKARALYEERDWLQSQEAPSFKVFLARWNGTKNGHDFFRIISHYKIDLSTEDYELLENFKEFTGWAGRYPYPKNDLLVKNMEKEGRKLGSIGLGYKKRAHAFIYREVKIMSKQ